MTSPESFFALVDRHVTGAMAAAGYSKIGEYDELTDTARGAPLVAVRSRWLAALSMKPWFRNSPLSLLFSRRRRGPKERVLSVGYEGLDEDGTSDDKWLAYLPGTDELDLSSWREELDARANWGVWNDQPVPTTEELERRLRVVGAVMGSRGRTD